MFQRFLPVVAAVVILVAAAVAHGLRTDRWGPPADLKAAADRLSTVPMTVGDWRGEAAEIDPRMLEAAQISGYLNRRYVNYYSKADVTVLILCGRPGPLAVHTPDVCYRGAGYEPGPAKEQSVDGHTFWVGDFTKPEPNPDNLRIWWAWSDGGKWEAASSPRTSYAGSKVLYKMYLIRRFDSAESRKATDASAPEADLFKAILPDLQKAITPTP